MKKLQKKQVLKDITHQKMKVQLICIKAASKITKKTKI